MARLLLAATVTSPDVGVVVLFSAVLFWVSKTDEVARPVKDPHAMLRPDTLLLNVQVTVGVPAPLLGTYQKAAMSLSGPPFSSQASPQLVVQSLLTESLMPSIVVTVVVVLHEHTNRAPDATAPPNTNVAVVPVPVVFCAAIATSSAHAAHPWAG